MKAHHHLIDHVLALGTTAKPVWTVVCAAEALLHSLEKTE